MHPQRGVPRRNKRTRRALTARPPSRLAGARWHGTGASDQGRPLKGRRGHDGEQASAAGVVRRRASVRSESSLHLARRADAAPSGTRAATLSSPSDERDAVGQKRERLLCARLPRQHWGQGSFRWSSPPPAPSAVLFLRGRPQAPKNGWTIALSQMAIAAVASLDWTEAGRRRALVVAR